MPIFRLQKDLLSGSSYYCLLSHTIRPLMPKLQSSTLENITFPCGGNVSHVRISGTRIPGYPLERQYKAVGMKATHVYPQLRCFSDGFGCLGSPNSQLRFRPSPSITYLNNGIGPTHTGMHFSFPIAVSMRYLSNLCGEEVTDSQRIKPLQKRYKKLSKSVAAAGKKSDTNIEVIDETDIDQGAPEAQSSIQGNHVNGVSETKKKSRTRKSKDKPPGTITSPVMEEEENLEASSSETKKLKGSKSSRKIPKEKANGIALEGLTSPSVIKSKKSIQKRNNADLSKVLTDTDRGGGKQSSIEMLPDQQLISGDQNIHLGQLPLYPPLGKSVVVVESVTKAKVIQGYLGDMYEVLPSYGHVRDLAPRSGSVKPDDDFSMMWEVPSAAWTHLKSIKVALNGAKNLILASDPDREGEAIAWHIIEMLQQQDALHAGVRVARVVFHEITEASIKNSLQAPRDIDANLVNAYLARRALDYLIGFSISPVLWRKLPGCRSAGRVQSSALSLLCDREMEIDQFKPQEYWTVDAVFGKNKSSSSRNAFTFVSHLTQIDSKKLGQLSISSETEAKDIELRLTSSSFEVVSFKQSQIRKNPPTPYITSTLQQDAANKLHFPATYTMKLAQKLYEGVQLADGKSTGLITYTRTDGLHIFEEAVMNIRSLISERYGPTFAADGARKYLKKVKNAQEAHEAIRPTDVKRLPSSLTGVLDEDALKLYTLIWSRTLACQMEPATSDLIQIDIASCDGYATFRASCSKTGFLGYQAVYQDVEAEAVSNKENEGTDKDAAFSALSKLKKGDHMHISAVELKQHHTTPPLRYNEGSLVKKLEELGIGRPSTYASTIKVLQERKYVTVKSRVLYPEFRGRMVSAFIGNHFSEVSDYSFTADMETELDNVSAGMTEWKGLLKGYWTSFSKHCSQASNVTVHQVEKMMGEKFGDLLFASVSNQNRSCPSCLDGTLVFKVSKFGAGYFIGCNQHPRCKYIARTLCRDNDDDDDNDAEVDPQRQSIMEEPKLIGMHPSMGAKVLLKNGPYGHYLQLGEDKKGHSPQRASVAHIKDLASISLEGALDLLSYPKTLGLHIEDRKPVLIKIGTTGFAVKHGRTMAPVPKGLEPSEVTLEKAMKILSGPEAKKAGRPKTKTKAC